MSCSRKVWYFFNAFFLQNPFLKLFFLIIHFCSVFTFFITFYSILIVWAIFPFWFDFVKSFCIKLIFKHEKKYIIFVCFLTSFYKKYSIFVSFFICFALKNTNFKLFYITHFCLIFQPQNIVLMGQFPNCEIKLCDLEVARVIQEGEDIREIIGTPDYVGESISKLVISEFL